MLTGLMLTELPLCTCCFFHRNLSSTIVLCFSCTFVLCSQTCRWTLIALLLVSSAKRESFLSTVVTCFLTSWDFSLYLSGLAEWITTAQSTLWTELNWICLSCTQWRLVVTFEGYVYIILSVMLQHDTYLV